MRVRNSCLLVAVIALAVTGAAVAEPLPWPEAHSGSYLGVQIAPVSPQQASALKLQDSAGAVITYVDQDGPACRAGLLENDVVVGYEGSRVQGPEQLQGLIHATPPQKTVTLTVVRSGQRKDVRVTLGSWNIMSHAPRTMSAFNAAPAPPRVFSPDIEVPSFTLLSSRHGLVVESLSPQLADYFGVPPGHGVLVRSVESGSPAAVAGLKAGDVIVKVNNEAVHDMADWQRGMHASGKKLSITVLREKREQTFTVNAPGPADTSSAWPDQDFGLDSEQLSEEMAKIQPEIERRAREMAKLGPSEKDLKKMRREVEKSMKAQQKEMKKMSREMAKVVTPRDIEKMRTEVQKSLPTQKDWEKMQREIQKSLPSTEELKQQVQAAMPTQAQWDEMRKQMDESMKEFPAQIQKQMEELRKEMEKQKFEFPQNDDQE